MPTPNEIRLQQYRDAEAKILGGQEYRLSGPTGDRTLRMPDLAEVRAQINLLERAVANEQRAASGRSGSFMQADFG